MSDNGFEGVAKSGATRAVGRGSTAEDVDEPVQSPQVLCMRSHGALLALLVSTAFSASGYAADALPVDPSDSALAVRSEADATCRATSARAGQLDTTFGANGMARVRFGADDDGGYFGLDVAGGRIVAAGWGAGGLGAIRFRLARLTASGKLDPSFGAGGRVATGWAPSTADAAYAVAVDHQRDGGIIAMGWRDTFRSEPANIALARYAPDGSLDAAGFGVGGKSLIDLGGAEEITDGLVLPDDAIVMVGRSDDKLLITRASPKGTLDSSFARGAGYLAVKVGQSAVARAVTVDANGRLLVVGSADMGGQHDPVVLRLTAEGALDRSFGADGRVVVSEPRSDERAVSVALSPDGRMVVASDVGSAGGRELRVRRFLADGSPDVAFGTRGVAESAVASGNMQAEDMIVLPGGGILVVGNSGEGQPRLVRYTCNGALDAAFGVRGVLRVDLGENGVLHTLRRYSNNQILLGGADVGATPGPGTYGVVVRMWM